MEIPEFKRASTATLALAILAWPAAAAIF